jgi:hypothetical protein
MVRFLREMGFKRKKKTSTVGKPRKKKSWKIGMRFAN